MIPRTQIETNFPFAAVSEQAARESTTRFADPSTLHPWVGRQPRAVLAAILKTLELPKGTIVCDPFSGSGMTGLAARRAGYYSWLGDANPVAYFLSEVAAGFPTAFCSGAVAVEVETRGRDVAERARKRLAKTYGLESGEPVIAWIWTRTVKSPSPQFSSVDVPLMTSFVLRRVVGSESYVWPVVDEKGWHFELRHGSIPDEAERGTQYRRGGEFRCLMSGVPITRDYIRSEFQAGRGGLKLVAVALHAKEGHVFRLGTPEDEALARSAVPEEKPAAVIAEGTTKALFEKYGITTWGEHFTDRQALFLGTLTDEILEQVNVESAVVAALMLLVSKMANRNSMLSPWTVYSNKECVDKSFRHGGFRMQWTFAEANPFGGGSGDCLKALSEVTAVLGALETSYLRNCKAEIHFGDVFEQKLPQGCVFVSELPGPNTPDVADLTDFFYMWLRGGLRNLYPDVFATMATPKGAMIRTSDDRRKVLPLLKKAQSAYHPAVFSFPLSERDVGARTVTEMSGLCLYLRELFAAGWTVTALWPVSADPVSLRRRRPSDVLVVARSRRRGEQVIGRAEFRTAATLRAQEAAKAVGGASDIEREIILLGGALGTVENYKAILAADGKPLPTTGVLDDAWDAIRDLLKCEDSKEDQDETVA